jgi:hypothetical protein
MGDRERRRGGGDESDLESIEQAWRPAPGKVTTTSQIGDPSSPRYAVSPGKRPLTLGLAARTPPVAQGPTMIARSERGTAPPPARVPSAVKTALSSEQGQPLADADTWSDRIGADVGHARLVTGDRAAAAAASIDARAFTVGERVFFGAGERPDTGGDLLRHELTHVAQQRGAAMPSSPDALGFTSPGDKAEVEARGSAAASPAASAFIGREGEPDIDAGEYRKRFAAQIGDGVASFLRGQTFSLGSPYVSFSSPSGFATAVLAATGTPGGAALAARLDDLVRPTAVETLVDKGRAKGRVAVDYGNDDIKSRTSRAPVLAAGSPASPSRSAPPSPLA